MIVFRKCSVLTLVSDTEMTLSLVGWEHIQTYTNKLSTRNITKAGGWWGDTEQENIDTAHHRCILFAVLQVPVLILVQFNKYVIMMYYVTACM